MQTLLEKLGRVLLPLVTPFDQDEAVNTSALAEIVNYVVRKQYAEAIIVAGTTGEFYALSHEERLQVLRTVFEVNAGRLPLIAGVGATTTREVIAYLREVEEIGYEHVMVVSPYYQKATQEGLFRHFKAVAEETPLPILLYNIPLFTGVNIEPETLGRLVDTVPNILGIKDEAGLNPIQTTKYRLVTPATFTIYCGDDTMILQTLPQGAVGIVSGGSHVIGDLMKQMIQAYLTGDIRQASALYFKTFPFLQSLTPNGRLNPISLLKSAIQMTSGIDMGSRRLPSLAATDQELEGIRAELAILDKLALAESVA